jgi:hypothetical protein
MLAATIRPGSSLFIERLTFYLGEVSAVHPAAIMGGDAEPMRKMSDTLVTDEPS